MSPKKNRLCLFPLLLSVLVGSFSPKAFSESNSTFGPGHDVGRNAQKPQTVAAAKMRRLLSLVEYIGGDYAGAVSQGKILDQFEYQEITEFSRAAVEIFDEVAAIRPATEGLTEIRDGLLAMKSAISAKKSADDVRTLAKNSREQLIDAFDLTLAPAQLPSRTLASQTFASHCASCHGQTGRGDGVLSAKLEPRPRDFSNPDFALGSSPFKTFNVLHAGVEGTAMASFADRLTQQELWSLAFWIAGLAHDQDVRLADLNSSTQSALLSNLSLEKLSRSSDEELMEWVKSVDPGASADPVGLAKVLAVIRVDAPYLSGLPRTSAKETLVGGDLNSVKSVPPPSGIVGSIRNTRSMVGDAIGKAQAKRFDEARSVLLDAYLIQFEPVERQIRLLDAEIVKKVETSFIEARLALNNERNAADLDTFMLAARELDGLLSTVENLAWQGPGALGEKTKTGRFGDFISSFLIIFREGFEAFLIIAALLAAVANMGMANVKRWIHLGWMAAVVFGVLTYFVLNQLVEASGLGRELVEAIATGLAAMVLFYVGFWILSQAERVKWDKFIRGGAKEAVASGRVWALVGLAFVAVYREAAETILFYNALANSASSTASVAGGFVTGTVALGGVCFLIQRFGLRMPMRKFFISTSVLMVALAVTLSGKAVAELIEAGIVSPVKIAGLPTIELLGLYPYAQTMLVQGAMLSLAILVWIRNRMANMKKASLSLSVDARSDT